MNLSAFFRDPRRRNLAILAAAALVSVILAVVALRVQESEVAPHFKPHTFFPGLAARLDEVARIRITSRRGSFDVAFKPYRGWVLPSRNDYPASYELAHESVVGMAGLMTIEPKTARPDWLPYVHLDAPPKGTGTEIALLDDHGTVLASMIVGTSIDIGDPSGAVGIFVRKPDSDAAWLVKSPVEFKSAPSDWMDKAVLKLDRARIAQTDIELNGSPSYEARRDKPSDADFTIPDLPKGRELADPGTADAIAAALSGFTFLDARPARELDFSDATRLVTKTFDGLTVTVETLKRDDGYWATISAEATAGNPDAAKDAREINGRVNGWAYQLPAQEGQLFTAPLESLLKPPGGAPPAAPGQ